MPFTTTKRGRFFHETAGEGTPLVFLAGLGGDHRAFIAALRYFAERYRTFSLDLRDAGRSDRIVGEYTTCDMADDVAAWMRAFDFGKARLVGHSLGGSIAQQVAIRHPELVGSLVLVTTNAAPDPWKVALLDSWVMLRKLLTPADFTRVTLPWLVAPRSYETPGYVDGFVRFAERNEYPQDADAFARQARAASRHDARESLSKITAPTLVLAGALDLVNSVEAARALAEGIGARLEVMPGVGHLPHIEDGEGFRSRIAAFLKESDAR